MCTQRETQGEGLPLPQLGTAYFLHIPLETEALFLIIADKTLLRCHLHICQ